jgi:two-component system alkaline phosphatase synthesis response regulator PhoP
MLGSIICKFVKQNPATAHIRVILISAHNGLPEIARSCLADGYIEKPFDIDVLLKLIRLQTKTPAL